MSSTRTWALAIVLSACAPAAPPGDGGVPGDAPRVDVLLDDVPRDDVPRDDVPRDAPRIDGGPCVVDEDCPGDPRYVRRCYGGLCANLGCHRDDARCDDGNPCTVDTCDPALTCENRPNGICCTTEADCNDGDACTIDRCVEAVCQRELIIPCGPCLDHDGDGHTGDYCGGTDCNDGNPFVSPDATEVCTGGGDEDCDLARDLEDLDCQPATARCDGRAVLISGVATSGTPVSLPFRPDTCGGSAFFEIPLPTESDLEVVLTLDPSTPTMGTGFDVRGVELATLLETTCGDATTSLLPALAMCDRYPTFFSPSPERRYFVRRIPAGAVFAEVQERLMSGVPGGPELRFSIVATVRPAERVSCDGAPVVVGSSAHFAAPTGDGLDCFGPWVGIASAPGPERAHAFTLSSESRVRIRATPADGTVARVGITAGCEADTARAVCEESVGASCQGFALLDRILPAGTHHAVVEASGEYDLLVSAEPVGEACAGASPVALDGAVVSGTTTGAPDRFQYTGTPYYDRVCGGATGPDVVHTLTLDREVRVAIEASTEHRSLLRLLETCGGDTAWASSAGSMVRTLGPGTYYLVLDGADPAEHGPYTLSVRTYAP